MHQCKGTDVSQFLGNTNFILLKKSVNVQNIVGQNSKQTKYVSQQFYIHKYDHSYNISVGSEIFLDLSNMFLMKIQTFLC